LIAALLIKDPSSFNKRAQNSLGSLDIPNWKK
jgi:hypothetical protein